MKKIKLVFLLLAGIVIFQACKKEEVINTYERPVWSVNTSTNYTTSMSAILKLAPDFSNDAGNNDIIAAFIGDECRGVGQLVEENTYFVSIKGFDDETSTVTIKYYNAKKSYLYSTGSIVDFKANSSWGIADDPVVLSLRLE